MARICIISPGQLACNPRVVKEAQALHDAGHEVTTISTRVLDAVEARDQSVIAAAGWRVERLRFGQGWRWRVARLRQSIASSGFAATGAAALAELAHSAMTPALTRAALATPAELYIAHYVAALPAAAAAARRHGARYAFDAEDFHLGDLPDEPQHDHARELIRAVESRYLPGAAYITAASPGIAEAYAETYGVAAPTVLLNTFPRIAGPATSSAKGCAKPGPSIYWFSQTIGPGRGLECAIDAIARAHTRPHLYLRGMPARGYLEALRARAAQAGVSDRLHLLEAAAPAEMERLASVYDIGLIGETGQTRNRRIALTNKTFSYLTAGLPILLSDVPAHCQFAPEAEGAAVLYRADDPDSLAERIDSLLSAPEKLHAARARAHALGQTRFCWEQEAERLLEMVNDAVRPIALSPRDATGSPARSAWRQAQS